MGYLDFCCHSLACSAAIAASTMLTPNLGIAGTNMDDSRIGIGETAGSVWEALHECSHAGHLVAFAAIEQPQAAKWGWHVGAILQTTVHWR